MCLNRERGQGYPRKEGTAYQRRGGDGCQRRLVHRSRSQPLLTPSVCCLQLDFSVNFYKSNGRLEFVRAVMRAMIYVGKQS